MNLVHSRPPRWDGHLVHWEPMVTSLDLHRKPAPCDRCGSRAPRIHWVGHVDGERYPRLILDSCPRCGLDQVVDVDRGETWILGPEDYGPEGSTDPRLPLWGDA